MSSSSSSSSKRSIPTEDTISALPDCLLCHILSFLPTKLAVTTSILSKRWKPVWLSVLTLYFDDQTFKDFTSFRLFVSSVFLMRDLKLPIRSFHLKCGKPSSDCELHDINHIVSAALQRGGIENLNFDNYNKNLNYLRKLAPSILRVLSCRTLVILKLKSLLIDDVPHMIIDLPSLKTLHLDRVIFGDNGYIEKLLYGCPVLEDLHITQVMLRYFSYVSEGKFKDLPKLYRANLFFHLHNELRAHLGRTIYIFPFVWVHNAKFLRAEMGYTYECQVPTFHNLIHMELIFRSKRWQGKWKWVIEMLKHCPKLQNLTIDEASKNIEIIGDKDWMDPETVPKCLSSQLRTCLLRNFKGIECELHFAEYIMQNSKLLRTMTIKSSCSVDKNAKHQMLVKLSMCSRGSGTCKLLFD